MPEKPLFIVSDLHLGAVPVETERAFRKWLVYAADRASHIVINGDLFDFWFEYKRVIPQKHVRVLATMADVVEGGVPITFVGGNHDWWGGTFFDKELGVAFAPDPIRVSVGSRTGLVAHGDGLGSGDLGYRFLRLMLRGRLTRWGFRWIHPDIGARIADRVSKTESRWGPPSDSQKERSGFLEEWARHTLATEPDLSFVALGHTHIPRLVEVDANRHYVNSGDWVYHRTYVTIEESGPPVIHEWPR